MSKTISRISGDFFPEDIGEIHTTNLDNRFGVLEPYYSEIVKQIQGIEKDLVLLTQSAVTYIQSCNDYSEALYLQNILQNLLDEHKMQMKVVNCADTTFALKS